MSIATEITRLQNAKAAIKTAIEGKGVTVPDATLLDGMAGLIESIEAGGDTSIEDGLVTRTVTEYANSRVESIGDYAFYYCSKLTSVNFPKATSIGTDAFGSCSALTSVNFPKATSIGTDAFYYCSKLTSVDFPNATSIGTDAFYYCSKLTSVDFPNATSIGSYAFGSCSALTSVVLRNTGMVCTLANKDAFSSTPIASGAGYIYVPDALVDSYRSATNWSTYAAQIKPLSEYTGG